MIGFALAVSAASLVSVTNAAPMNYPPPEFNYGPPSGGWTGQPVMSGYWPSYQSKLLPPTEIQYDVYTHIEWFVASTQDSYELNLDGHEEDLSAVVQNAHAAGVTVSMSVGGWTGSQYFSDLVANDTSRAAFASSLKSYYDKYELDGVDLDWEYPGQPGIGCNKVDKDHDAENFYEFLKVLRETLGLEARITAAISIGGIKGPDDSLYVKTAQLANYLDYMTIMAYDVYGPWSATTGPLGPWLDTCATEEGKGASGFAAIKLLTEAGFPANKLLLGMPSYSRALITASSELTRTEVDGVSSLFYQNITKDVPEGGVTSEPAGTDVCGTETPKSANWLFNELISSGKLSADAGWGQGNWTRIWDHCSQTPFLFNSATREFIAYDDPQSYEAKATYALNLGLAGINMFDLTGDTRDNMLIRAARKPFFGEEDIQHPTEPLDPTPTPSEPATPSTVPSPTAGSVSPSDSAVSTEPPASSPAPEASQPSRLV